MSYSGRTRTRRYTCRVCGSRIHNALQIIYCPSKVFGTYTNLPSYKASLLHGAIRKTFDWAAVLEFIRHIFLSEQFWTERYEEGFNYRNWVLFAAADLISEGTKDDTHAFDARLLPLAEEILLILVDKAQQSVSTLDNLPTDVLNSDRGRVFSAMIDYALRFARTNESEYTDCRWPYAIRADFTKRLDRNVEPRLNSLIRLDFHLPLFVGS